MVLPMSTTSQNSAITTPSDPVERERWLEQPVRLGEAARLRKVHKDTLKKEAILKGQLLRLSARVLGVRRRFALMID
jgi:hypothetical protein